MQTMYAEDAVWDISGVFTDVAPIQGHESLRRYWDEVWETWEGVRMDPLEVFDVGDGRYVVDVRLWGKGKRSGVEVDQRFAYLYTLRPEDEKIIRAQLLPDVQSAVTVAEVIRSLALLLRHRLLRKPDGFEGCPYGPYKPVSAVSLPLVTASFSAW